MTGIEIFLLIFGILIVIIIIIIVILAALGYFGTKKINQILQGNFSFAPLTSRSQHVTSVSHPSKANDTLVLSTSTTIPCSDYSWKLTNNFLQLNNFNATVIPGSTGATGPSDKDAIQLQGPTGANDFNQWVFKDDLLRWCLKSNESLCIRNNSGTLELGQTSFSSITQTGFEWIPENELVSPACSSQ